MKKICFLVSGGGGPLRFVYHAIRLLNLPMNIVHVIGDRPCAALDFAAQKGIRNCCVTYKRSEGAALIEAIKAVPCDYIVTNFNKILAKDVLDCAPGKFINVHPSLLPAYAGMIGMETVHAAEKDNAQIIGATCHELVEKVDAGRIVQQCAVAADWRLPIEHNYTGTFRCACLSLLNFFVDGDAAMKVSAIHQGYLFSPACRFDILRLDEDFWSLVKSGQ